MSWVTRVSLKFSRVSHKPNPNGSRGIDALTSSEAVATSFLRNARYKIMNKHRLFAVFVLSLPTIAQAASVSNSTVGCNAETDAQKVLGFMLTLDLRSSKQPKSWLSIAPCSQKAWRSPSTKQMVNFCACDLSARLTAFGLPASQSINIRVHQKRLRHRVLKAKDEARATIRRSKEWQEFQFRFRGLVL